jgi:hypothetical protein
MLKKIGFILLLVLLVPFTVSAVEVSQTLEKVFTTNTWPREDKLVKIRLVGYPKYLKGNTRRHDNHVIVQVIDNAAKTWIENGWAYPGGVNLSGLNEKDAGNINIDVGEGMTLNLKKSFMMKSTVHIVKKRNVRYYRGKNNEDFKMYWNNIIEEVEEEIRMKFLESQNN